jgi:hypothetical protein
VAYLTVDDDVQANICIGSDDSVQVLVDETEVLVRSILRGWGGTNQCEDIAVLAETLGTLTAGTHRIMVKVFNGTSNHGFRLGLVDPSTGSPLQGARISLDPVQDPYPYQRVGVEIRWNGVSPETLRDGLSYTVGIDEGTFSFDGHVSGKPIHGSSGSTVSPAVIDAGAALVDPDFEHCHDIGYNCPGAGAWNPEPGTVVLSGAGADIGSGGDQFRFAYLPVDGDFSVKVTVAAKQFAPGSRWGKFGLMARQDCTVKSRFSFIHDQGENQDDNPRFSWRPTHGGSDNREVAAPGTPPKGGIHANTYRLDRIGSEFVGLLLDETGEFGGTAGRWVEVGRCDWGPDGRQTVNVGLVVSSASACNVATITFKDWELTLGTPPQPPQRLSCAGNRLGGVDLTWGLPGPAAGPLTVRVQGASIASLSPEAREFTIQAENLPAGVVSIVVENEIGRASCGFLNAPDLYINCGGPRLDAATGTGIGDGRVWEEDSLLHPSPFLASANAHAEDLSTGSIAVADTTLVEPEFIDDPRRSRLFATERWDNADIVYRVPTFPGAYEVTLLFAEGCCSDGCQDIPDPLLSAGSCRVFDIQVNGETVASHFSQHVEAQRALGNAIPNSNWGVALAKGPYRIDRSAVVEVVVHDLGSGTPPENAAIKGIALRKVGDPPPAFHRGDSDASGDLNITDGIFVLNYLFLGGPTPACLEAANANDDALLNITDGIFILNFLFLGGTAPPAPGPAGSPCGEDPAQSSSHLGCGSYPPCGS